MSSNKFKSNKTLATHLAKSLTRGCGGLLGVTGLLLLINASHGAMAPWVVNMSALDTMGKFIRQHQRVAATLESIDMTEHTIYFDGGCKAIFAYPKRSLFGDNKNAFDLTFQESTCPLTYTRTAPSAQESSQNTEDRHSCETLGRLNEDIVRHTEWLEAAKQNAQAERQAQLQKIVNSLHRELDRTPTAIKNKCKPRQ
jgi:hypothetical protein